MSKGPFGSTWFVRHQQPSRATPVRKDLCNLIWPRRKDLSDMARSFDSGFSITKKRVDWIASMSSSANISRKVRVCHAVTRLHLYLQSFPRRGAFENGSPSWTDRAVRQQERMAPCSATRPGEQQVKKLRAVWKSRQAVAFGSRLHDGRDPKRLSCFAQELVVKRGDHTGIASLPFSKMDVLCRKTDSRSKGFSRPLAYASLLRTTLVYEGLTGINVKLTDFTTLEDRESYWNSGKRSLVLQRDVTKPVYVMVVQALTIDKTFGPSCQTRRC
jgi:hypothetical protein